MTHMLRRCEARWRKLLSTSYILALMGISLIGAGCESLETIEDKTPLQLRIVPLWGEQPYNVQRVKVVNGRVMTLQSSRMYISEVALLRADGTSYRITDEAPLKTTVQDENGAAASYIVTDKILLFRHDQWKNEHFLGLIEPGSYSGIRFKLGIDGLNNRVDGAQIRAADHPLGAQGNFRNYWSPQKGYIYLRMGGFVDSDGDGLVEASWNVHLGTTDFIQTLEWQSPFTLKADEPTEMHFSVDYSKFIAGVDYSNPANLTSDTTDNLPVARSVHAAIPGAFILHGVKPITVDTPTSLGSEF